MDLRPYQPTDREACLNIFDSNFPRETRGQFERFLEQSPATYFVMEHEGALLACGGYHLDAHQGLATLVWGMVRRSSQKMGLGRYLLMYRLREIGKEGGIDRVCLQTPPESAKFFEGQGFKVASVANGSVGLLKKLTVCP
jgi:N-acetylglutamate synthase-like GNAT family acetyltransferase